MATNNTANNDNYFEYNDNRSIHQPSLFDFLYEELDAELLEDKEQSAEMYEVDFEELDVELEELFLN